MALTKEDLQAIAGLLEPLKEEIQDMKAEIQDMKAEIQDMKERITKVELHFENCTDKNIQLLAENFVELTKKLNQAIPAADKNLAYEVKVSYLIEEVKQLKADFEELKKKIA